MIGLIAYRRLACAVGHGYIGQISHLTIKSKHKDNLKILASYVFISKQIDVGIITTLNCFGTIKGCTEMHNWCYSLCDNSLKHQLAVCLASRKLYNIIILSIVGTLIIYAPIGMHYSYQWISLHYLDLFIKFHRVNPIVIASAIGYIFASTRQQAVEIIIYNSLVGGCWHKPNDVWIAPDIIFAYSSGAVSRSIIANNNLYRQSAFLHQYRVESARYAVMLVVCNYYHRNQAIVFHYICCLDIYT